MQIHFHFKQVPLYCGTGNTVDRLCVYWQLGPSSSCAGVPTEQLLLLMYTQLLKITITTVFNEAFSQFTCGQQLFLLLLCFLLPPHLQYLLPSKTPLLLSQTSLLSIYFAFGHFLWLGLFRMFPLFFSLGNSRVMTLWLKEMAIKAHTKILLYWISSSKYEGY